MGQSDADLDHIEDTTLMVMFANGQPAAARALTARLLPRVLGHAARVLGNRSDAEDVAQEAMLRLWKAAANWAIDG
ncbi:MAG: RNA polymerase sigma-70 factor (ECF subfamily), partial [Glaciecola sp.]